jgi:PAT family beta-lactamase induction signal transducer AmpG
MAREKRRFLESTGVFADALEVPRSSPKALWITTSYLGEGLPWSVMHQMATEYLTAIHAPLVQIGSTSLLHFGTTLKLICGPLVDITWTKRGWMIAMQATIGLAALAVASLVGLESLWGLWVALSAISLMSSLHDVACDGNYIVSLDRREQAAHQGTRQAAFRGAMILAGSGLVYLAGRVSWVVAFAAAGGLMIALSLVNSVVLPRVAADQGGKAAAAKGVVSGFLESYRTFLTQPHAAVVLAFVLVYRLGDVMMFAMAKPLLRDLGVDTATRGVLNGLGIGVFVGGSFLGGLFIARRSLARALVPMTYFQNFAILLYAALAFLRPPFWAIVSIVLLEQFASSIGVAANMVFLIQRCRGTFSASHYAFVTALVGLMSTLAGPVAGWLDQRLGHGWFFTLAFVASWPGLVLVWIVPRTPVETEQAARPT